jgi:hypothetical protein
LHIDLVGYDDGYSWHEAFKLPHMRSSAAALPQTDVRRWACWAVAVALGVWPTARSSSAVKRPGKDTS